MANSKHLKPEEVNELVNRRNREKRQKVPHHMDVNDKAKNISPQIDEVKKSEVEVSLKEDTLKLSNLEKGVEIIYTKDLENQKDKEKVTFIVERFIGFGGYAKTYLVNLKMMDNMRPMIIKEFCPDFAVRDKNNHLVFNMDDSITKQALEDFKKEPQRIKDLLAQTSQEQWEGLNLVIPHTENTFTCFGNEYYVMEYVPGKPLTQLMKESGETMLSEDKLNILKELCVAVSYLHRCHCVHQDLSSNNVLVSKDEHGFIKLKVIDYGMCTTLKYREGQGYSEIRRGGTPGFRDDNHITTYKIWSNSNNDALRERLKLIDIYSLGAVLAYIYLLPSKYYSDKDNGFEALDYLITADQCGAVQKISKTDIPAVEKSKILYNMVRELVVAATHPNINERIQTVNKFMDSLQRIIDFCNTSIEIPLSTFSLEEYEKLKEELEEEQKLREEEEEKHRQAIETQVKEIERLQISLKAKDETSKQEIQNFQIRLLSLKKELNQKEQDREAEKKCWEEEKNQAQGKEQKLTQRINFLTEQQDKEKHLKLELETKYNEAQEKVRQLTNDLYKLIEELNKKPENPPLPWYKRYKQPLLIAFVVLCMAGVAGGIGSIDWNRGDIQLKAPAREVQVQPVEDTSSLIQPAEADINVPHQLQPEQLTALIQQARQDEKMKQRLLEELCTKDVMVWEEEGETIFEVPVLQLFGNIAGRYPVVGYTHKVKELEYNKNGKINLIVLVRIK